MNGKPRNKRLSNSKGRKQQHLLEVTVRHKIAVSQRNRAIASFIFRTCLWVGIGVGLWFGGNELLRRYLWENPEYSLAEIRVPSTDGALTKTQIVQASGLEIGRNIFQFDLGSARAAIEQLAQVERAEIRRRLPNRIDITVTERRPIAWVAGSADEDPTASDKALLIDARGIVMRSKRMLPEYFHLPVIWGVPLDNLVPGQQVSSFEMQAALELIRLSADNTRWQARSIDLSKGYCLIATDRNHARITFGLDNMDRQLDRWFRYLDIIEPTHQEILTANLMVERNTPFTFADPLAETGSDASKDPGGPESEPTDEGETKTKSSEPSTAIPVARAVPVKRTPSSKSPTAASVRKPFRPH